MAFRKKADSDRLTNRRPVERRGEDDEFGKIRDRRDSERRVAERRGLDEAPDVERRTGTDRREQDQRETPRRSGADRRAVSERLNRVSAILLPRLLSPREDEDAIFDDKPAD